MKNISEVSLYSGLIAVVTWVLYFLFGVIGESPTLLGSYFAVFCVFPIGGIATIVAFIAGIVTLANIKESDKVAKRDATTGIIFAFVAVIMGFGIYNWLD